MTTLADIQRRVGVTADGVWGPNTAAAIWSALPPLKSPASLIAGPDAIALIKQFEGCEKRRSDGNLQAYPDPGTGGDPWTIGWGSTGPGINAATVWTQAQADERFAADLAKFSEKVWALVKDAPTTQHQFDALVALSYNVGIGKLSSSRLLALHKAGGYGVAVRQFARWNKAAGKVLAGLTRRRAAEASLYGRGA